MTECPTCAKKDLRVTAYEYKMAVAGLVFIATIITAGTIATFVQWGTSAPTKVTSDQ